MMAAKVETMAAGPATSLLFIMEASLEISLLVETNRDTAIKIGVASGRGLRQRIGRHR
jgi:hypothetical protein